MLGAHFSHFQEWVLALSDISNQVFSLYPYAKSLQTGFKTGQTPKSRRVCQAETVRQFFLRRRSVDQLPTADSASKYLLSDPSSLLLQQSNLASEHCGGVGACLDCLQLFCSVAGQEVGRGCCCKHHRRWRRLQSVRGFPWLPFCSRSGKAQPVEAAAGSGCWAPSAAASIQVCCTSVACKPAAASKREKVEKLCRLLIWHFGLMSAAVTSSCLKCRQRLTIREWQGKLGIFFLKEFWLFHTCEIWRLTTPRVCVLQFCMIWTSCRPSVSSAVTRVLSHSMQAFLFCVLIAVYL